jgi:hypothetical protein
MSSADTLTRPGAGVEVVDTEALLRELMSTGFQFIHPRDAEGGVVAVVGIRAHHNVVDVVRLHAEDDVVATRVPAGEVDILEPETVLWSTSGGVRDVLDRLLKLPEEHPQHAVGSPAEKGCWVPGRAGRAKWLAATA